MAKPIAEFANFEALDIRAGRIVKVEDAQTKKPTYRITVDFGSEIEKKVSCGAYRNYTKEELMGKTVVSIINFSPKMTGPEISEVLILGVANERGETVYLTTANDVPLGESVF